jgi:hypothetical protein
VISPRFARTEYSGRHIVLVNIKFLKVCLNFERLLSATTLEATVAVTAVTAVAEILLSAEYRR